MEAYEKMLGLSRVPGGVGDRPVQGAGIQKPGALAHAEDPAGYQESPVTTCCLWPPSPCPAQGLQRPGPACARVRR